MVEYRVSSRVLRSWSGRFTLLCLSLSLFVLAGWQFDIDFFKRPLYGLTAMNPTTALCLLLCSGSILMLQTEKKVFHNLAYVLIGFCFLINGFRLLENSHSADIGIDQFFFGGKVRGEESLGMMNRMSFNGSFNFILISMSIFLLYFRRSGVLVSQILSVITGLIAWLAILGYVYRVPEFYGLLFYLPMAIHSAICFIFLSLALLFFRSDQGIPHHLFSNHQGGRLARFLFPILLIGPFVIGYLRLVAHWNKLISTEFGVAILIVSITLLFSIIIFASVVLLNRQDKKRKQQESDLLALNDRYEQTNEEVAVLNEELTASNEELNSSNEELTMMNEALSLANERIREQAEIIVTQKDEQLNRALDSTDIIIWSIDLTGKDKNYISRSAERMTGISSDAFANDRGSWFRMVVPEDIPKRSALLEELKEKGNVKSIIRIFNATEQIRWIEVQLKIVKDAAGKPVREEGIASDITSLKQTELSLAQERNLLRSLIDNVPDYIFIKNKELQHIVNNKAMLKLIGEEKTENEIATQTALHLFGSQAEAFHEDDRRALSGESIINREEKIITGGVEKILLTTKVPLRDLSGQITGLIGISRDITETKERDKLLNQYRQNLDIIFSSTLEEILLMDEEGKVVLFNNALEKFILSSTGKKPVVGNYLWNTTVPERSESAKHLFNLALSGQGTTSEAYIKGPGGILVHELRYQPIFVEGKVKYVMLISLDVTERKNQENSIRKSEGNLRAIFNSTKDAFVLLNNEFKIQAYNKSFRLSLFEQERGEIKEGDYFVDLVRAERREVFRSYLERAKGGEMIDYEIESVTNEKESWYQVLISAVKDNYNHVIGICITLHDLKERKEAENLIRTNENRFRVIIENSHDFFVIAKPGGESIYISPNVFNVLGYTAEELTGAHPEYVIPAGVENTYFKGLEEALQKPGELVLVRQALNHKNGQLVWLEGTISNLLHVPGINGLVSTFRDISGRKKSEDEKNTLVRQLIEHNNDLLQFSFIASHNLRGPVASMMGLLNLCRHEQVSSNAAELLGLIDLSVNRLDTVIKDLSLILEMRSNEMHAKEWVKIEDVVTGIKSTLQSQIKECNAVISIDDKPVDSFYTTKSYFHSILYNLISNAIKYRSYKRDPIIEITTFRNGNDAGIRIKDNGIGIDLERFKDKVFMLYQRFHLEVEGRGLGLYMVRSQVQTLNGSVDIESQPDKGTEFIVTFRDPELTANKKS